MRTLPEASVPTQTNQVGSRKRPKQIQHMYQNKVMHEMDRVETIGEEKSRKSPKIEGYCPIWYVWTDLEDIFTKYRN